MVWCLWATYVLEDIHHMRRRVGFDPPEEITGWVALRQLIKRYQRPRSRLRPSELALLVDYGDWLIEQRSVEADNAASLKTLLQAAAIMAVAHGDPQAEQVRKVYNHIANEFGVLPPSVEELPPMGPRGWSHADERKVYAICEKLARESEVIPDWMFYGRAIPASERPSGDTEGAGGGDSTLDAAGLFDDP